MITGLSVEEFDALQPDGDEKGHTPNSKVPK